MRVHYLDTPGAAWHVAGNGVRPVLIRRMDRGEAAWISRGVRTDGPQGPTFSYLPRATLAFLTDLFRTEDAAREEFSVRRQALPAHARSGRRPLFTVPRRRGRPGKAFLAEGARS